jgi:hypothetical protein
MSYEVTKEQIRSITVAEVVLGTTRLLPRRQEIPARFWRPNPYSAVAQTTQLEQDVAAGHVLLRQGFIEGDAPAIKLCILAHMRAHGIDRGYQIAGIALMISRICEIAPEIETRDLAAA